MKKTVALMSFLLVTGVASAQSAQSAPDLTGTWVGTSNAAVRGSSRHHPSDSTMSDINFNNKVITWVIDRQEGRNFSGTVSSKHNTEPLIGALSGDLKSGVIANTDGRIEFKLVSANKIDMCYSHNSERSIVVNCVDMFRNK
jgi:hypothetical protein